MYGGGSDTRGKDIQSVVVTGQVGCGRDAYSVSVGGTDGWGGGVGQRQRRVNLGEDNISNITLGTEPNSPLVYALGLEHHHPIMSTLGKLEGILEREIGPNLLCIVTI